MQYRLDRFVPFGLTPVNGSGCKTKEEAVDLAKKLHNRICPVVVRRLRPPTCTTSGWKTVEEVFGSIVDRAVYERVPDERKGTVGKRKGGFRFE